MGACLTPFMARCPNCNHSIGLMPTWFLHDPKIRLQCPSCNTFLKLQKASLDVFFMSCVVVFVAVLKGTEDWLDSANSDRLIPLGIGVFLLLSFLFYLQVRLELHPNQSTKEGYRGRTGKVNRYLFLDDERVRYLMGKFANRTNGELRRIMNDSCRLPEAHEAARQVLAGRKGSRKTY
ncbi:hypothetical protein [Mangrovimonas sp. DI 80]|uniref:hypothetical protein n=1 Tax=Mangrovimonas sp. DI 80 TaxID=1779330 RepID=UPI00097599DF|nr:hypothetical protein [Mangrovimonas sp. DI 80]